MRSRLFLIAFALTLAAFSPALAVETRLIDITNDRWIEVSGEGSVRAAPDFARVTLGVTTTGKDAREAMAANAKSANALVALIKSEGVAPADIQTSDVSISPMFSNQPPAQASTPAIIGYSVSDSVTVTVRDISSLGALLDKAVAAGANAIYRIGYGENDPSALLDKARPLAVADARRKAEIYALAGGAKIGRLMELTEEAGARPVPFAARAFAQGAPAPTPIEPGQDKLTVTVTARFELTQERALRPFVARITRRALRVAAMVMRLGRPFAERQRARRRDRRLKALLDDRQRTRRLALLHPIDHLVGPTWLQCP
jgi:uncharacterized protein YggE